MTYVPNKNWITVFDLDFTVQTTQTMNSDTTYTIGGYTFTKHNSSNESSATVLTNGTGIVFSPSSTGDYINSTRNFPLLFLPFSQMNIPNLDWQTGIRVWAYISSANPAANYDNTVLSVGTDDATNWYYAMFRGQNGSQGCWLRRTINSSSTTSGVFGTTLTSGSTAQIMCITVNGLWDNMYHANLTTGTPWPSAVRPMNSLADSTGVQTDGFAGNAGSPGAMGVIFGALRAGSGTSFVSTIARLRVDVKN